jgi:hypothetical protein
MALWMPQVFALLPFCLPTSRAYSPRTKGQIKGLDLFVMRRVTVFVSFFKPATRLHKHSRSFHAGPGRSKHTPYKYVHLERKLAHTPVRGAGFRG